MTTSPHAPAPGARPRGDAVRSRAIPRPLRIALEAVLIYVAYTALGELNRQFTPPPAGISPIWLPAGFAVGVVLVRGMWTAIPLFLTGVINTVRADLYLTEPVSQGGYGLAPDTLAWAALLYGCAVAGHCVLAKLLVDRLIRDHDYDSVASATAFLVFVGPLSCILSGLLGTEVFRVEGFIDDGAFLVSAFTFWIGDSIACMVLAPVFVALAGGARWRSRRTPIIVLSIGTMLIVIASTSLVGRTELDRIQQGFERSTTRAAAVFEGRVLALEAIAQDVGALIASNADLTADEFDQAVGEKLGRTSDADIVAFVATPDARIADATIRFAEGPDTADLRSSFIVDPLLPTLELARTSGKPAWVPEGDDPGAIRDFVYAPVYLDTIDSDQLTPGMRVERLVGFVAVRTNLPRTLAESTDSVVDRASSAVVRDERGESPSIVLAATPRPEINPLVDPDLTPLAAARTKGVPFASSRTLDLGQTEWSITFAPSRAFVTDRAFLVTILPSSLIALAFTLTIGVLALTSSGQRARLARLVRLRTRELIASERRYRSVVDNVREAVFQLSPDDRVTFVSAAWNELLRNGEHAVVGEPLVDALHVAEPRRLTDLLDAARAEPGVTMRGEFATADQELVLEIRVASPKVDDDDLLVGAADQQHAGSIVGMIVDMTEQRTVLRNRERFVSMVAHELRNPLTVISGSVATISSFESDQLPPVAAKLLPAVQASAYKLDRIIADLLVSSQVDAGTLTLHPDPTDLRELVRTATDAATVAASERGVTLVDETEAESLIVTIDGPRVLQVVDNMLSNAIKYTPSGGSIRVATSRDAARGQVFVRIADTGIGIAPADRARIFERYGRAEAGSALAEGTGLGLAICRAIAEAHGGSIELESELGVGSTFVLVLPAS